MPREYPGAPPLVPHDISKLKINRDGNACISCHITGVVLGEGHVATKIPRSHYTDIPTGIVSEEIQPIRNTCRLCHLPQSAEEPLVK